MTELSQFLLRTTGGRIVLVALVLLLSLFFASIAGWLPTLH
jgi:hypothetical protein